MLLEIDNNGTFLFKLTKDEALVLFEWLSRFNEQEAEEMRSIKHPSELSILYDFEALLQKKLCEPFKTEYLEIIAKAQQSVHPDD